MTHIIPLLNHVIQNFNPNQYLYRMAIDHEGNSYTEREFLEAKYEIEMNIGGFVYLNFDTNNAQIGVLTNDDSSNVIVLETDFITHGSDIVFNTNATEKKINTEDMYNLSLFEISHRMNQAIEIYNINKIFHDEVPVFMRIDRDAPEFLEQNSNDSLVLDLSDDNVAKIFAEKNLIICATSTSMELD